MIALDATEQIQAILAEELALYGQLATLADEEHTALLAADHETVRTIAGAQAGLVETLREWEQRRIALVGREASLTALAEESADNRLLALRDDLVECVADVQRRNARNQTILASLIGYSRDRVQGVLQQRALYGGMGQPQTLVLRGLLDRRA